MSRSSPRPRSTTRAGAVLEQGTLILTADYFRIDVADRLAVTQDLHPYADRGRSAPGSGGGEALADWPAFAFSPMTSPPTTQGIDLVFSYAPPRLRGGTVFSAVFNHTDTRVTHFNPELLNAARRLRELQEALPRNRWNASVSQKIGPVNVLGRLNYYGAWFDWDSAQTLFNGKPVFDLEVGLPLSEETSLAIGARNAFNTFPDVSPNATSVGEQYSEYTPWGFNGAYFLLPPGLLLQEAGAVEGYARCLTLEAVKAAMGGLLKKSSQKGLPLWEGDSQRSTQRNFRNPALRNTAP